jgi:hypothetical protein
MRQKNPAHDPDRARGIRTNTWKQDRYKFAQPRNGLVQLPR